MNWLILYTLEWSPTQFALQCDQWFHDGLKYFLRYLLLLERTFIICLSPCSFLFALHLDWFLNTKFDKKIKWSFYICKIVFYISLLLKLSIFFSLVLFSLEMHKRSVKKLTGKKLYVDRWFFKDVLWVTVLQGGWNSTTSLEKLPPTLSISID